MSYVRGKYARAAVDLLSHLRHQGIEGGPVAQPSKRDPVIVVYGMTKASIKKLPKTFAGFAVEGKAGPPDYMRGQLNDVVPIDS